MASLTLPQPNWFSMAWLPWNNDKNDRRNNDKEQSNHRAWCIDSDVTVKEQAIRECLQGNSSSSSSNNDSSNNDSINNDNINNDNINNDNQAVNLWQLRTLALQRGGLVSAEWRKRAWPKLVGAYSFNNINNNSNKKDYNDANSSLTTTNHCRIALTRNQVTTLQTDLRTSVWNVQDELRRRKQARQVEQAAIDARLEQERVRNKRVTFHPAVGKQQQQQDEQVPDIIRTASTHSQEGDQDDDHDDDNDHDSQKEEQESTSGYSYLDHQGSTNTSPCGTLASHETNMVSLLSCSSVHSSSRAIRGRKATVLEQRILYKIVTNLLQQTPPPTTLSPSNNFHHHDEEINHVLIQPYTYHPGFQDLVSLLLYNVESPTVTSMMLPQLATHHWRVLLSSKSKLEGFLAAIFMPLLSQVDPRLSAHLQDQGMMLPTFCRSWVATWFASDTGNAAAASRLLDVLLVSHPWMVVYLSVAFVTNSRATLLAVKDFTELAKVLRRLPYEATTPTMFNGDNGQDDMMETVENVIAKALKFIEKVPPQLLQTIVHNLDESSSVRLHADACIPPWLTAHVAPTDWAILAKRYDVTMDAAVVDTQLDYPLAMVAAGQETSRNKKNSRTKVLGRHKWLFIGIMAMAAIVTLYTNTTAWPWHSALTPLRQLTAGRRILPRISRKALVPYALLEGGVASINNKSTKEMTLYTRTQRSNGGAAAQAQRLPWWKRVERVVRRFFHHVRCWEKWIQI